MSDIKKITAAAITAALAIGMNGAAVAGPDDMEKCYGVAKAGMNDCGSSAHSCAGQATKDSDTSEWIYVPKGICGKIVGGTTK